MEDVNPADDPNNQGEDEFEEAEQEREENLPDENEKHKQNSEKQGHPGVEEHLVVSKGKESTFLSNHLCCDLLAFCITQY